MCTFFILTINGVSALESGVSVPLVADEVQEWEEGILLGAEVIVTNGTGMCSWTQSIYAG